MHFCTLDIVSDYFTCDGVRNVWDPPVKTLAWFVIPCTGCFMKVLPYLRLSVYIILYYLQGSKTLSTRKCDIFSISWTSAVEFLQFVT